MVPRESEGNKPIIFKNFCPKPLKMSQIRKLGVVKHDWYDKVFHSTSFKRLGQKSLIKFRWFFCRNDDAHNQFVTSKIEYSNSRILSA